MTPVLLLDAAWRIDRVIGDEYACELLVTGRALPASEDIARVFHSPSIEVAAACRLKLDDRRTIPWTS